MDETLKSSSIWQNQKFIIKLVGLILLAGIIFVSILRDRIVNPPQWQVQITGQGKVSYAPDIAVVQLGVQIDKSVRPENALYLLNDKMTKIIDAVVKIGIPKADIQTANYSLYPQYDFINNISTLMGYSANQQLSIKIKDLKTDPEIISKIVAQATEAGANQVTGITFDVSNLNDLKQEAKIKAIEDAKTKSAALASAAGVRLKKVVGWWENYVQLPTPSPYYYDGKGGVGSAGSPQITAGQQEIIVEIGLSYQIR